MTWPYFLGGADSIGLLVYLIYVLINAEEF